MKNLLYCFILSFGLFFSTPVKAETIIIPIDDLSFVHTNFNAPDFSLNSALNGRLKITEKNNKHRGSNRQKIIDLMWDLYPDAKSIRVWRGNVIIKV
jgi:hypothetical protein